MIRLILVLLTALAIVGGAPAWAQATAPAYFTTTPDAVTGDNLPVQVNHPGATCGSGADRCYLPDANPSVGSDWVDNYTLDIYERPMGQGSNAKNYLPWIDITSSAVGYDANFLYYRIQLYGTDGGQLPSYYSFEINFDNDTVGDILVRSEAPTSKVGTSWGTSGVTVYHDANQNMGGPRPTLPDGPANTLGGYESLVFDQGTNNVPGAPGGNTAVRARIDPANSAIIELAVRRSFMVALNGGQPVLKASFRPHAAKGSVGQNQYLLHDEYTRGGSGSPYPWLRLAGAPASCPTSLAAENALTLAQRDALDSGTSVATAFLNPCYPASSIYELDSGGTTETLGSGGGLQFEVDLSVSKTASADPVAAGGALTYTITAMNQNAGAGQATGVTVIDQLPAGTGFVSATPAQGSCVHAAGVVTCALGTLANGASAAITIIVNAPATVGPITNEVSIAANETDPDTTDNSFSLQTTVAAPPLSIIKQSQAHSDPLNGATNPKLIPGGLAAYTVTVSNPNSYTVTSNSIVVIDPTPAGLQLSVGDFASGSGPIFFQDGSTPSGLTFTFSGLASQTDDVDFSNDGGATWSYTPTSNADGVDPAVSHIRINPKGTMAANSSFSLTFAYLVQ